MKKLSWILVLAGLALAQVNLSGQLDTNFGVRTSDATLSLGQTTLKLDLGYDLDDATLKATLNLGYDALTGKTSFSLGEAYATVYLDRVDLTVGNQVISWGRVDYLSPEDVLNPKDLARPLADPSAQKLPVPMIHATVYPDEAGVYQLEAVWIPRFTPSVPPRAPGPSRFPCPLASPKLRPRLRAPISPTASSASGPRPASTSSTGSTSARPRSATTSPSPAPRRSCPSIPMTQLDRKN